MLKKLFILVIGLTLATVVEARGGGGGFHGGGGGGFHGGAGAGAGAHDAGRGFDNGARGDYHNGNNWNRHPTGWNGRYHQNQAYYANGLHGGRYWNGGYYGGIYYAPGWVGGYCVPGYYSYPACLAAF